MGVLEVKWLPPQPLVSNQMVAEEYNFRRQFYEFSFWDVSRERIGEASDGLQGKHGKMQWIGKV